MESKTDFRIKVKNLRKQLNIADISNGIISNIRQLELYKQAGHVLIFYPLKYEINLLPLLEDNKEFYLPRVRESELEVCGYKKGDVLKLSDMNILEPETKCVNLSVIDIIFVPALMCDKSFCRLGYGGGYYDRLLSKTEAAKIVVIPEELLTENIPKEEHDVRCDIIVTQKKSLFLRG